MESIFIFISLLGLSFAAHHLEMCAQEELITDVTLSIYVDEDASMAKFVITGPSTAWFAYGIGNDRMNGTYAIIGYGSTLAVQERILGDSQAGPPTTAGWELTTNNERSMDDSNGVRTISIEVPYSFSRAKDLQSFIDCTSPDYEMDIIAAHGTSTDFFPSYHGYGEEHRAIGTIMNMCCMDMDISTTFYNIATDATEEDDDDTSTTEEEPDTTEAADGIEQMKYIWNIVCVVFMGIYYHY